MVENIVKISLERVPNDRLVLTLQSDKFKDVPRDMLYAKTKIVDAAATIHTVNGYTYMPSYSPNVTLATCLRNVDCFNRFDDLDKGVVFFIRGLATNEQMEKFVNALEVTFKQAYDTKIRSGRHEAAIRR